MSGWLGKTIGKVRIDKYLARGGMGEIYLGTHLTLERPVAVKVLHSYIEEDPDLLARFQREARVVAGLRHPNIVQIYDFDAIDGHPYIVMEYFKGPPLDVYLRGLHKRNERIPHNQVARLLKTLTSALDYAHEQDVIHRDIKPANIMLHGKAGEIPLDKPLTNDVEAILMDFGLVRITNTASQTTTGMVTGTPAYMSPEQARGDKTDLRTDIYSLGIVLYEMLAGRVPFEADSTLSLIYKQINEPPPPIPGISSAVQKVIDRSLAKKPEDRYPSSRHMAADFFIAIGMTAEAISILGDLPEDEKALSNDLSVEVNKVPSGSAEETQTIPVGLPEETQKIPDVLPEETQKVPDVPAGGTKKVNVELRDAPTRRISSVDQPKAAGPSLTWIGIGIISVIGLLALAFGAFFIFIRPSIASTATKSSLSSTATKPSTAITATRPSTTSTTADVAVSVTPTVDVTPTSSAGLPASDGMVEIASGSYQVGKTPADDYHSASMDISLKSFWIDIHQVTASQYQQFLAAGGAKSSEVLGKGNQPVRGVTWDEAVAYCSWVNKRLPTEAEWETAGRGPGPNPPMYPWGNDPQAGGNIKSLPDLDTYEVGTLPFNKSPFGVYDMVGNVWEWVGDPYASTPAGLKILRGGRFGIPILDLSYRLIVGSSDSRYVKFAGFRCAADQVEH